MKEEIVFYPLAALSAAFCLQTEAFGLQANATDRKEKTVLRRNDGMGGALLPIFRIDAKNAESSENRRLCEIEMRCC